MFNVKNLLKYKRAAWEIIRSPRTVAALKLGAAVVGVVHAIDELMDMPKVGKRQIGFRADEDED